MRHSRKQASNRGFDDDDYDNSYIREYESRQHQKARFEEKRQKRKQKDSRRLDHLDDPFQPL